jgi:outer membrane protein assembly factor BamB
MFRQNRRHTGRSSYSAARYPTIKWRYQTGGAVQSSAAVGADGTTYVGSNDGYLYAIHPDGSLKWRYQTADAVESSPAIGAAGIVYIGSNDGHLYGINPDGTPRWRYPAGDPVRSSPVIAADGTIYVGSHGGSLYAINSDGSLKWRHSTITSPAYPQLYSSPAIGDDGTIYISTGRDDYLYAIYPDGSRKWARFLGSEWGFSSPAVAADGTIHVGSDAGCLHVVRPDGTLAWGCAGQIPSGSSVSSSPALGIDGTVYVGVNSTAAGLPHSRGYLLAIELVASNPVGVPKWSFPVDAAVNSSPAIDANGTIYFGANDGHLYAVKPDGTLDWRLPLNVPGRPAGAIGSSPAIGADGTIYVGSSDGHLYAVGNRNWLYTLLLMILQWLRRILERPRQLVHRIQRRFQGEGQ